MAPKKAKQPVRKVKAGAVIENAGVIETYNRSV